MSRWRQRRLRRASAAEVAVVEFSMTKDTVAGPSHMYATASVPTTSEAPASPPGKRGCLLGGLARPSETGPQRAPERSLATSTVEKVVVGGNSYGRRVAAWRGGWRLSTSSTHRPISPCGASPLIRSGVVGLKEITSRVVGCGLHAARAASRSNRSRRGGTRRVGAASMGGALTRVTGPALSADAFGGESAGNKASTGCDMAGGATDGHTEDAGAGGHAHAGESARLAYQAGSASRPRLGASHSTRRACRQRPLSRMAARSASAIDAAPP